MRQVKRLTTATDRTITVGLLKSFLRIDGDQEDNFLLRLIEAAEERLEDYLSHGLLDESWVLKEDAPPRIRSYLDSRRGMSTASENTYYGSYGLEGSGSAPYYYYGWIPESIVIPIAPLRSVTHIKIFQDNNQEVTLDTAAYTVNTRGCHGEVIFDRGYTWPPEIRLVSGLEIEFISGYENSDLVPRCLSHTVLEMAAYFYNNRGEGTEEQLVRIMNHAEAFKSIDYQYGYPE